MLVAEVAPLLGRTEATVASLANRHEIGAYKIAGRWQIAGIDVRGFAASDARAAKSDLALVLEPAPGFTGDVGGAFAHLPERLPSRTVAKILRVSRAKLTELGLVVDAQQIVERGALVELLRSVSNFGPHYSPASSQPARDVVASAERRGHGVDVSAAHGMMVSPAL